MFSKEKPPSPIICILPLCAILEVGFANRTGSDNGEGRAFKKEGYSTKSDSTAVASAESSIETSNYGSLFEDPTFENGPNEPFQPDPVQTVEGDSAAEETERAMTRLTVSPELIRLGSHRVSRPGSELVFIPSAILVVRILICD